MKQRSQTIKRTPIKYRKRKNKPGDDPKFLAFVRSLPCLICYREVYEFFRSEPWALIEVIEAGELFRESRTEAAHLGLSASRRGLSQKYPDNECGPLCADHHTRLKTSHHAGTKTFWKIHNLDRDDSVRMIQELYREALTRA